MNASKKCQDGRCLPTSLQCDGVEYCNDDSTSDVLCRESLCFVNTIAFPLVANANIETDKIVQNNTCCLDALDYPIISYGCYRIMHREP